MVNKSELIEKLQNIDPENNDDREGWHLEADYLILEFINDPDITKAYNKVPKWYA